MKTLNDFKILIETNLDIKDCLVIEENKIIPNKTFLNKKTIKKNFWDDLFQYHDRKLVFTNRMMHFVAEITDRKVLTSHYFFELK